MLLLTMVLVIDDSAPVREVLRLALESEGYRVIEPVATQSTELP
jgi:CheY-like chemotaxis protein